MEFNHATFRVISRETKFEGVCENVKREKHISHDAERENLVWVI